MVPNRCLHTGTEDVEAACNHRPSLAAGGTLADSSLRIATTKLNVHR